ncbi:MAG: phosphoglucosamine mutase [Alphaproteobacteria bacterium]|nr:phosphoglucosamine mutase [Alphaproteobacteria bacterium]
MSNKLFGTDGIRGVANLFPMTAEVSFRLAQVLSVEVCNKEKRVAIAKDTRISGDMLESALVAGFTSMGVSVIKMGVVPTPLVTSQTKNLSVDMAVMITASHNPYQDNGIKLINSKGDKFDDEQTAKIEELLTSNETFVPSKDAIGKVYEDVKSIENYMETARKVVPNYNALKGLRVVLDCANGAFSKIMPQIFKDLGAGVITLSNMPDGYNINKDCGSQHTQNLQDVVVQSKAHLGIAVDGDGDRIIICDEKGNRIDGDQIIAFLATYFHEHKMLANNAVVATIWSNLGLEKYLHRLGIDYYRSAVGERYVIDKMRQVGSNVGGEESGHMVLSDYCTTGDALVTALVISDGLLKTGKKMSDIFPLFEKCPCQITNIRFLSVEEAVYALNARPVQDIISSAKHKIAGQGSVIVRKSGTEPVVKVRVEGEDETLVSDISNLIVSEISKYK